MSRPQMDLDMRQAIDSEVADLAGKLADRRRSNRPHRPKLDARILDAIAQYETAAATLQAAHADVVVLIKEFIR